MDWARDVISLALYELRCPSLDYVYRMSWAEFQIRLFAYLRTEKAKTMKVRDLAWTIYTAPHRDPKKLAKTINQFWPLEESKNKPGPTDKGKENFMKAYKEFQAKKEAKK